MVEERKSKNSLNKKEEKIKNKEFSIHIKNKRLSNNSLIRNSSSYYKKNNNSHFFSKENSKIKEKNRNNKFKQKILNRSFEKRHKIIYNNNSVNNINTERPKKRIKNSSLSKEETSKIEENKTENKKLSIFTACENIKNSNSLLKNKNRILACNEKQCNKKESNYYESNKNIHNKSKKDNKHIIYNNQNLVIGVKKTILNNPFKPWNLANKLLQNGRKYITEFNGIKEEEKRKLFYY